MRSSVRLALEFCAFPNVLPLDYHSAVLALPTYALRVLPIVHASFPNLQHRLLLVPHHPHPLFLLHHLLPGLVIVLR